MEFEISLKFSSTRWRLVRCSLRVLPAASGCPVHLCVPSVILGGVRLGCSECPPGPP